MLNLMLFIHFFVNVFSLSPVLFVAWHSSYFCFQVIKHCFFGGRFYHCFCLMSYFFGLCQICKTCTIVHQLVYNCTPIGVQLYTFYRFGTGHFFLYIFHVFAVFFLRELALLFFCILPQFAKQKKKQKTYILTAKNNNWKLKIVNDPWFDFCNDFCVCVYIQLLMCLDFNTKKNYKRGWNPEHQGLVMFSTN